MPGIETSKTVNGCWNCKHGGNLKIFRTLLASLNYSHGVKIPTKIFDKIMGLVNQKVKGTLRCSIDDRYQCETGFICNLWKYNDCGFQEKKNESKT